MLFFSLVIQAFLSLSLHPVSVWSCFLGLLSFRSAVVPGSLITLRYLLLRHLVTGPVWSQGFLYLSMLGCQCPSVVLCHLPSVRRSSLGYSPTRSLSLLRLFGPFLGALLSAPSSFSISGLLSARLFDLSPCLLGFSFLLVVGSCLLSTVGRLVSPAASRLWLPSVTQGSSSPGFPCSVPSGCLFGSLPSSPVPPVSLPPGGCHLPWVSASTTCVLAFSSGTCFPGVVCSTVCLQSRSHLRCLSSVFSCSIFGWMNGVKRPLNDRGWM